MGTQVENPAASVIGGARRDRTADLLHAMQALSQLSYSPTRSRRTLRTALPLVKHGVRLLASAASMRARLRSRPSSASVASIGGETAVPVTATRSG